MRIKAQIIIDYLVLLRNNSLFTKATENELNKTILELRLMSTQGDGKIFLITWFVYVNFIWIKLRLPQRNTAIRAMIERNHSLFETRSILMDKYMVQQLKTLE
jgi:hypothetical protein